MKILLITDNYPVDGFSSSSEWLRDHVAALSEYCEVDVLSLLRILPRLKSLGSIRRYIHWCVKLLSIAKYVKKRNSEKHTRIIFTIPDSMNWSVNPILVKLQGKRIGVKMCTEKNYDAILVHWTHPCGSLGIELGRIFNIPVCVADNNGVDHYHRYFPNGGFSVNKEILLKAACTITQSTIQSQATQRHVTNAVIRQAPLGISLPETMERRTLYSDKIRIVTLSRLDDKLKNVDVLVNAMKHLPEHYHLSVFGEGYLTSSLEALATFHGIQSRVHFNGWLHHDAVDETLRKFDIFVLPSDYETFGLVFLEALRAGLFVVARPVGIIPDLLSTMKGVYVIPESSANSVASSIVEASNSLDHQSDWSRHNLQMLKREYSWDNHAQIYKNIFDEMVKKRKVL